MSDDHDVNGFYVGPNIDSGDGKYGTGLLIFIFGILTIGIGFDYASWGFAHAWNDYWIPFLVWIQPVTDFIGIEPNLKAYVVPEEFGLFQ